MLAAVEARSAAGDGASGRGGCLKVLPTNTGRGARFAAAAPYRFSGYVRRSAGAYGQGAGQIAG